MNYYSMHLNYIQQAIHKPRSRFLFTYLMFNQIHMVFFSWIIPLFEWLHELLVHETDEFNLQDREFSYMSVQ